MTAAEILAGLVKPPIWDEGNRYGDACAWQAETEKGRFCYGVDLAGLFYMQTPEREHDGFPTLAAAKAAAEADHRARIAAALDVDKIVALVDALADAAGALDSAGEELSDFANILSRDPWQANQAYESAVQARAALAAFRGAP